MKAPVTFPPKAPCNKQESRDPMTSGVRNFPHVLLYGFLEQVGEGEYVTHFGGSGSYLESQLEPSNSLGSTSTPRVKLSEVSVQYRTK